MGYTVWWYGMPCGWRTALAISHPDELAPSRISSRWLMANGGCHPDDLRCCPMSSGWHNVIWIWSYPDELASGRISSGWLITHAVSNPDGIRCYSKSSWWHDEIWVRVSHPDDLLNVTSHPDVLRQIHCVIRVTQSPTLKTTGWENRFKIFTIRSGLSAALFRTFQEQWHMMSVLDHSVRSQT